MNIQSVKDDAFTAFGQVLEGYDFDPLLQALKENTPAPTDGVIYVASDPELEKLDIFKQLQNGTFGGIPIELGYCNGTNTKLNCLEYHRGSELNIAADDVILLLAQKTDLSKDYKIDADKVQAFKVPAGVGVLLYETSMHYAPASDTGSFRVVIVLPKGTNLDKPEIEIRNLEDQLLWAANKWLIACEGTSEAQDGAYVGISANIDIAG